MRAEGYYWVKDDGEWEIAKWFEWHPGKYEWDYFDRTRKDEDFEEIDERRIERTEKVILPDVRDKIIDDLANITDKHNEKGSFYRINCASEILTYFIQNRFFNHE